jgi:hypothetical protein
MSLVESNIEAFRRKPRGRKSLAEVHKIEPGPSIYERTTRNREVIMPELMIAASWVLVMKLTYGLDGEDR